MEAKKLFRYILSFSISFLLGGLFLVSAYSKLFPIEPFEYAFVEAGVASWKLSLIMARLFIGLEFACGAALILQLWYRKLTLPLVSSLLILFTVYLFVLMDKYGNTGNCGCFGSWLSMTPMEGVVKNVVMFAMVVLLYFIHQPIDDKWLRYSGVFLFGAGLSLPFIVNPMFYSDNIMHPEIKTGYALPLEMLYESKEMKAPEVDIRKGKWVIAFLSQNCSHCRIAAKKLRVIHERNPEIPMFLLLDNQSEHLKSFLSDTRVEKMNWMVCSDLKVWLRLAGMQYPQILWVNNSIIDNKSNYLNLQQEEIEDWLRK